MKRLARDLDVTPEELLRALLSLPLALAVAAGLWVLCGMAVAVMQ